MTADIYSVATVSIILLLFGIKKAFESKDFIKKYVHIWNVSLFVIIFAFLSYHFYKKGPKIGMLAVGMGAVAVGKYMLDRK